MTSLKIQALHAKTIREFNDTIPETLKELVNAHSDEYDVEMLKMARASLQEAFLMVRALDRDDEMTQDLAFSIAALVHDTSLDNMIKEME